MLIEATLVQPEPPWHYFLSRVSLELARRKSTSSDEGQVAVAKRERRIRSFIKRGLDYK